MVRHFPDVVERNALAREYIMRDVFCFFVRRCRTALNILAGFLNSVTPSIDSRIKSQDQAQSFMLYHTRQVKQHDVATTALIQC